MYPKPIIVSDLYPRIFTDPAIRRRLSKREETRSKPDYYNQILSSITLDELNRHLILRGYSETIFIYSYNIDKLGNLTFEYDVYGAKLRNNSIEYRHHERINIKQSIDDNYSQTYYQGSYRNKYTIENLKQMHYGKQYYFDIATLLEGILMERKIPRNVRYQLLKIQYDKIKNDLKNYPIPFYLYLNQFALPPGELEGDLEIDENYDVNELIPHYENKIDELDRKNIQFIEAQLTQ